MTARGRSIGGPYILDDEGDPPGQFVRSVCEARATRLNQRRDILGECCALLLDQRQDLFECGRRVGAGGVSGESRREDGGRRGAQGLERFLMLRDSAVLPSARARDQHSSQAQPREAAKMAPSVYGGVSVTDCVKYRMTRGSN